MKDAIISVIGCGTILFSALTSQAPVQSIENMELKSYTVTQVTHQPGMELRPSVNDNQMAYFQTSLDRLIDTFPFDDLWRGPTPSKSYDIVLRDLSTDKEEFIEEDLVIRDFPINSILEAAQLFQSGDFGLEDLLEILDYAPPVVAWSPDGNKIAYNVNEDIFVEYIKSGYKIRAADFHFGRNHDLSWSDDGRNLLYEHDGTIYLTDTFTRKKTNLGRGTHPKFMSDSEIIYSVDISDAPYIAFRDTNGLGNLTQVKGTMASPSQDGEHIAYLSPSSDFYYDLHISDVNFKNDKVLYTNILEQELEWSDENVLSAVVYRFNDAGKVVPVIEFFDIFGNNLGEIKLEENTAIADVEWGDASTLYFDKIRYNLNIEDPFSVISDPDSAISSDILRLELEWAEEEDKLEWILNVNEEFTISLDSNPTTGYGWEASYDKTLLELVENTYESDGGEEFGRMGGGGTEYFRFRALDAGDTQITLVYKRPWEEGIAEQKIFAVNIIETPEYTLGIDEQFTISLDSNPTTGYNWEADYDKTLLELVENTYESSGGEEFGRMGGGGTEYFRFRALDAGDTQITMVYKRPWEEGIAEQKIFTVNIEDDFSRYDPGPYLPH